MKEINRYSVYYAIWRRVQKRKRQFYIYYNRWLFDKYGYSYGSNMQIFNDIFISGGGTVTIGDNFLFRSGDGSNPLCKNVRGSVNTCANGNILIGNNVGMSSACLWAQKEIRIGNNVNIGGNCVIIDSDAHPIDYLERRECLSDEHIASEPIMIEDDVWLGANTIVLKGVHIGARTVIGAGSVVTKSIPSDCIAAGNPCRVIKKLVMYQDCERVHQIV